MEKSSIPTKDLTQKLDDIIFTDKDIPRWRVTDPKVGYGSLIRGVIVEIDISVGSDWARISSDYNSSCLDSLNPMRPIGNYQWLPEGMNITVTKTLSDDVEIFLEARILKNDGNMLILDKPLIVDKPTLEKMKDKYKVKRAQLRYKVFEFSV